jgi:hypothetical protein
MDAQEAVRGTQRSVLQRGEQQAFARPVVHVRVKLCGADLSWDVDTCHY